MSRTPRGARRAMTTVQETSAGGVVVELAELPRRAAVIARIERDAFGRLADSA